MTIISKNKIFEKLSLLDEYLNYLKEIQKVNKKSFLNDYHFHGLAERYLQLSIQILIDLGQLIITEKQLSRPAEPQEIFSVLFNNKILSEALVNQLTGIVGFRNILVHEYGKIDREKVYEYLKNNLEIFKQYKKEILKFIKKG